MQLTRPKYFFGGKNPEDLDRDGRIGPVGQASAALEGLLIGAEVQTTSISHQGGLGAGTVVDFLPPGGDIPAGWNSGWPKSGYQWFEFDHGFIGWPEGDPIDAEAFRRSKQIPGMTMTDPTGMDWDIPIARGRRMEFGTLPTRWAATPKGLIPKPTKEVETLWTFAGEVFDYLRAVNHCVVYESSLEPRWGDPYGIEAAIRILGVNYHFGQAELLLLEGLDRNPLTTDFSLDILNLLVDSQALIDFSEQKKTRDSMRKAEADRRHAEEADSLNSVLGELAEAS